MSNQTQTKAQKREELSRKKKIKANKGATLSGQILRTQTSAGYQKKKK